ncbi:hypothetical protein [Actinoplanes sp. NPDC026670]|uniref:DUF7178 family protein n=1 Tax=Actinoplanes sp. NPDC026670 TaxID=3154700 RepID=UPI0033D0D4E3
MGKRIASTPDARLREVCGTSTRATADRIVETFRRATPADIVAGAQWYGEGESFIDRQAALHDLDRETVAAVVAHLSPRTTWQRNLEGTVNLLAMGSAPGCIGDNVDRARHALAVSGQGGNPMGTLNGPKTRRFAANLLGDREAVTVDVWAARVAFGPKIGREYDVEKLLAREGVYDAVEHAYKVAAQRLGIDPVTVQATTWIVARNGRAA